MAFGSRRKVESLEAEVARLNQWIAHLQGTDAVTVARQVDAARQQLAQVQQDVAIAQAATRAARAEEAVARDALVEHADTANLQEAGFYVFTHPLDDAVAYKTALTDLQGQMKAMIRAGRAVESSTTWTVNNSAAQGRKMVKDMSKLMLRAYNAEADSVARALRPHTLASAKSRMEKSAFAIERLGKMMSIRIAPDFHRLRLRELELTADFLVKKQQEREAERERRAQLRDQQRAAAEMATELARLTKERDHYTNLLAKLSPTLDPDGYAAVKVKLDEIAAAISGVEQRAANIRTGHVYVISNVGAFGPDMIKIGMTRRLNPYDRVVELGDASVPFRFDVHAMVFHEDAVTLETRVHQALAHRKVNRINTRREFFYATAAEVKQILTEVAGAHLVEYRDEPDALEWHASGSINRQTQGPADSSAEAEADALDALEDATSAPAYPDAPVDDTDLDEGSNEEEPPALDLFAQSADDVGDAPHTQHGDTGSATSDAPDTRLRVEDDNEPNASNALAATPNAEGSVGPSQPAPEQPAVPEQPVPTLPSANWYPDPHRIKRLRYWDGQRWTEHLAD